MAKKPTVEKSPDSESENALANDNSPHNVEKHVEPVENVGTKTYATKMELGVGAHLLGQTLTLAASRGSTLEVTPMGVHAVSLSGRVVLIPWANIKCVELSPGKSKIRRK